MKNAFLLLISFLFLFPCISNSQNLERIDSLTLELNEPITIYEKVEILHEVGVLYETYDNTISMDYHRKTLNLSLQNKYRKGEAYSYNGIGRVFNYDGNYDSAKIYLNMGLSLGLKIKDTIAITDSYDNLGLLYYNLTKYDSAIHFRNMALPYYTKLNKMEKISDSYVWIGNYYSAKNNLTKSIEYHFKALDIQKSMNDNTRIGYTFVNLASIYRQKKDYTSALEYDSLALIALTKADLKKDVATVYNNIGNIYMDISNWQMAEKNHRKALLIRMEIYDTLGMVYSYNNLAAVFIEKLDYKAAEEYLNKSITISANKDYKYMLSISLINLGDLYYRQNRFKDAITIINKGLPIAIETENLDAVSYAYKILSDAYENSDDFQNSLLNFKLFKTISDSITKIQNSNELNTLLVKFETEEKDKQILEQKLNILELESRKAKNLTTGLIIFSLLGGIILILIIRKVKHENSEKKLKEQLIVDSQTRTKNKIADQLHGVSNSLIASKEKLNSFKNNINIDDESEMILDGICNDIEHVRKFTRTLSYNIKTKSFWKDGLLKGLEEYFSELNSIEGKRFIFQNAKINLMFEPEAAIDIFEIIEELISNSLKHGEGIYEISLYLRLEDGLFYISYEDDGIGFNTDQIFTSKSMGWKIIADKVENKYGGKIVLESTPLQRGNRVDINIPLRTITN